MHTIAVIINNSMHTIAGVTKQTLIKITNIIYIYAQNWNNIEH